MVGLLATHALAGQRVVGGFEGVVRGLRRLRGPLLNATTAEDYTRCVFQKVPRATCEIYCGESDKNFYDGPTASRAEAFALCDRDPDCDAVQQYDGSEEIANGWALPCGATTCYMKCRDLGEDGCGRTMVSDRRRLDDACYKAWFEHVYLPAPRRNWDSEARGVLAVPHGHDIRRTSCRSRGRETGRPIGIQEGPCTLLGWSLFSWFLAPSSYWRASRSGRCTSGRQGRSSGTRAGVSRKRGAAIGIHSAAGSLLVHALLGMLWWRCHRELALTPSSRSPWCSSPRRSCACA